MGGKCSKNQIEPTSENPNNEPSESLNEELNETELVSQLLIGFFESLPPNLLPLSSQQKLKTVVQTHILISEQEDPVGACQRFLNYLRPLLVTPELFSVSCEIIIQTNTILKLNNKSLIFFNNFFQSNKTKFDSFFVNIKNLCDKSSAALALQGHHLDEVVLACEKQRQLPKDFFSKVCDHWGYSLDFTLKMLFKLRNAHMPKLLVQTTTLQLVHHSPFHALEIRARASTAAFCVLSCFEEAPFLRELLSFFIEFHDYEYKEKGEHSTVEKATCELIIERLKQVFCKLPLDDLSFATTEGLS